MWEILSNIFEEISFFCCCCCCCCCFLGLHPKLMEVPRLGVKSELSLLAYTTATAMQDPSHICDLHHRSWQHRILNPLSKAWDWTLVLTDTSWTHFGCTTMGTSRSYFYANIVSAILNATVRKLCLVSKLWVTYIFEAMKITLSILYVFSPAPRRELPQC